MVRILIFQLTGMLWRPVVDSGRIVLHLLWFVICMQGFVCVVTFRLSMLSCKSIVLYTYLLPYSMEQSLSWEAKRSSAKKFSAFHGTRKYIAAFSRAHHLSLTWARSIQSLPPPNHPTSWNSILISSLLRLDLPSGSFPQVYPPSLINIAERIHSQWHERSN